MPLTNAIHDSLPYIDDEPTAAQRAAAQDLINLELGLQSTSTSTSTPSLHDSIPPLAPSGLSSLMTQEMERLAANPASKLKAIDLSRYESLSAPPPPPSSSDKSKSKSKSRSKSKAQSEDQQQHDELEEQWRPTLHQAYTSQTYLAHRSTSLSLLETYGKNAWLISNAQLEAILRALEQDLADRKTEIDNLVIERKTAQEAVGGEIRGLEETWKRGVGRVLETEVAAEGVRREILERRRMGAA